ncbi:Uncharacterized protein dnm_007640 [Desulfonema magnum]|uniref:Uncharacterized protein n=1 Tax=Desulfonema magnum TaxID=45655 RepID=A0A975GKH8_9BACT|nr:Uncharacterized protein dnm_007640 [Desulfonema magnum]
MGEAWIYQSKPSEEVGPSQGRGEMAELRGGLLRPNHHLMSA